MNLKVHFLHDLLPEVKKALLTSLDESILFTSGHLPPDPDFQILVTGRPDRSHLEASPFLQTLIIPYAGLPDSTRELLVDFPQVSVHNLHHNAIPTAESAIMLMMAASKFLLYYDRPFRKNDWSRRYQKNPSILLHGKTVLILGFGEIGKHAARVCQALGMKVLAIRRHPKKDNTGVEVKGMKALNSFLQQAQFLVVTLPLTKETLDLINVSEIAQMPRGSVLVNVGRGPVVDQKALYEALQDGQLSAAGLDVWYNYPQNEDTRSSTPPSDYPFAELENVIMTPHRSGGGSTYDVEMLRVKHLSELLNAVVLGKPIPNQIDLQAGY